MSIIDSLRDPTVLFDPNLRVGMAKESPIHLASFYADMVLSPGQRRFIGAIVDPKGPRQIVAKVGRGLGKTKCAAIAFAWLLLNDPTWKIFVLSGAFDQALRLYSYFLPLVTNKELFPYGTIIDEPKRYLTLFQKGGSMEILTASAKRIRGGHVDILCIDEAVLVQPELIDAVWPTIRASKRGKRIVMSTPSNEINLEWFIKLWQDRDKIRFTGFEWSPEEAPWLHSQDEDDAKLVLDSETMKIEYRGEIGERKGRVWATELIDGIDPESPHAVTKEIPPPSLQASNYFLGHDWGFVHSTVITVWELNGETIYLRDLHIHTETPLSDIALELKEAYSLSKIYTDSSGAHENDMLTRMGLNVTPVSFSKDKDELIGHVRWRLEKGLLKIPSEPRFEPLVTQMKAYHYDMHGHPAKVHDDCVDSMLCAMKHFIGQPERRTGTSFLGHYK